MCQKLNPSESSDSKKSPKQKACTKRTKLWKKVFPQGRVRLPCVQCLKCNPIESFQGHLIYDGGHMVAHPHDLKVCPSCQAVLVSWAMVGPSPSTRGRSYPSSHHTAGRAKTAGHEETPAATIAHCKVITCLLAHRSIKTSFHKFHT